MNRLRTRSGFVLVTILWVIAAASTLVADVGVDVALDMRAAANRAIAERAYWRARGCATLVRVEIERVLRRAPDEIALRRAWDELDRALPTSGLLVPGCVFELEASGTQLAMNSASAAQLRRLLGSIGTRTSAEAITSTIIAHRRHTPFVDPRELRSLLVMSEDATRIEPLVSADSALIALNHASREVLIAFGWIPPEVVERLIRRRAIGIRVESHRELEDGISAQAAELVRQNMPAIAALTTVEPESWLVRVHAEGARGTTPLTLEERLIRTDRGTAVIEARLP